MIGQTISHYKILEKLGEGGMGVVYKARDMKLDRDVALKFLPFRLSASEHDKTRFIQEAKAASSINHPNVCTIYSIDEQDGQLFIVMEYVEGSELKNMIARGPLPIEEALTLAIQIAEGLRAAHKTEIVHRDIKSSNIMLTETGQAKIMDFGLAKTKGSAQLTRTGTTVGTVAYMSPEQARGEDVDHRTDIWSFGMVLYELLTGQLPFKKEYEQATIYSILNEEPEIPDHLPADLKKVLRKVLAKNPDDRYQSAGELSQELRALKEGGSRKRFAQPSKLPWVIAAGAAVLVATAFFFVMPSSRNGNSNYMVKSIAVLPFVNMSSDPDQEYFSDGLSEELINVLAKNTSLRVTARTSSFSFKGVQTDIKTIAEKLKVQNILEGSVRKSGNALRITAQLIDVETDAHLWSETYNETMDNIFAVQDTISNAVAEALKIILIKRGTARQQRETNPEAYNAYLLGKYFYDRKDNAVRAAGYFQQALSIDSSFAPAWVELSRIHSDQANDGTLPVERGYERARLEVGKALELDPNLADAHLQSGWIKRRYDWDWSGADESYKRALKLDPGNARIISAAAGLARTLGRFDEAMRLMRRSVELNPVSPGWHYNLGLYARYADLLDESQTAIKKCLELDPQFSGAHAALGLAFLAKGKTDSALAEMMVETELDWKLQGLALVYHALGNRKGSDTALSELIKGYQEGDAYQIAEVYAYRGEANKAFEWLERAYDQRDGGLASTKGDPLLRNIENDPRSAAFMKKMRLPL